MSLITIEFEWETGPESTNALWVAKEQVADFLNEHPELQLSAEYAEDEDDCKQGWKFFFTGTKENLENFTKRGC